MIRAATLVEPHRIEVRDHERPRLDEGWGFLTVEVCGLCGTDVEQVEGTFTGSRWPAGPLIPGHEVVGVVEEVPAGAHRNADVVVGDRVVVEPSIPCGLCRACLGGEYVSCRGWPIGPFAHGFVPVAEPPGLWGGWAEAMVLHPNTVIHRVPDGVDAGAASVFNALATGFEWAVRRPTLRPGQSVLVQGAGQRGLASVVAARAAGAGQILVSGVASDRRRLDHALALGADVTVDVSRDPLVEVVDEATGGLGVDVVVDTSAGAVEPVTQAVTCASDGGTVVLAGLKGGATAAIDVDDVVLRAIRVLGARSATWSSYELALDHLATDARLGELRTHVFDLDGAADAAAVLGGDDPDRVYVSIDCRR